MRGGNTITDSESVSYTEPDPRADAYADAKSITDSFQGVISNTLGLAYANATGRNPGTLISLAIGDAYAAGYCDALAASHAIYHAPANGRRSGSVDDD